MTATNGHRAKDGRNGGATHPFVSVLVTAGGRRQYLLEAVRSALDQSLLRSEYEVLVAKDFSDLAIERTLRAEGVDFVTLPSRSTGAVMAAGVRAARGEVICFLDDDDLFARSKVEIVRGAFAANEELTYFHNGLALIDENGSPIGPANPERGDRAYDLSDDIGYCTSCISIRASMLAPFVARWSEVPRSPDSFLDFVSRASPGLRLRTMRPLTQYRIHPGSTSARTNHARSYLATAKILWSRPRSPSRDSALTALLGRYMSAALRGRSTDRRSALSALGYLATSLVVNQLKPDAREVMCGALLAIDPKRAVRLYTAIRKGNVDWLPPA